MSAPDPRLRISDSDRERAMADLAMHGETSHDIGLFRLARFDP